MFDFPNLMQNQLGKMFGVASHKVGKWLKEVGLRDQSGEPTQKAWDGGYCQWFTNEDGITFPVWDRVKVPALLVKAGHQLADQQAQAIPQPVKTELPSGPFTLITDENGGHQIVDQGGQNILTKDPKWLSRLVTMINQAIKKGYL